MNIQSRKLIHNQVLRQLRSKDIDALCKGDASSSTALRSTTERKANFEEKLFHEQSQKLRIRHEVSPPKLPWLENEPPPPFKT